VDFESTDVFRKSVLFGIEPKPVEGKIWAFDSEFLLSKDGHDGDVLTIQFSDGEGLKIDNKHNFVFYDAESLKTFLHNHRKGLKVVYAFVALPDIGSLQEWLGSARHSILPHKVIKQEDRFLCKKKREAWYEPSHFSNWHS